MKKYTLLAATAMAALILACSPMTDLESMQAAVRDNPLDDGAGAYREWGAIARLDGVDPINSSAPAVSVAGNGDIVAAWVQGGDIYYARYNAEDGKWSAEVRVTSTTEVEESPAIACSAKGSTMIVWEWNNTMREVRAALVSADGTLGSSTTISTLTAEVDTPSVAWVDATSAIVVWRQSPDVYAAVYSGGGWASAKRIDENMLDTSVPRLASNDKGTAIAVWFESGRTPQSVYASAFSAGAWGIPFEVDNAATENAFNPRVAFDGLGNAIFAWARYSGSHDTVWVRHRNADGTLSSVSYRVDTAASNLHANYINVVGLKGGGAMLAWVEETNLAGDYVPMAREYSIGDGLVSSAVALDAVKSEVWNPVQLAASPDGWVTASWVNGGAAIYNLSARRYKKGLGWDPDTIKFVESGSINSVALAAGPSGTVIQAWAKRVISDAMDHIFASVYE